MALKCTQVKQIVLFNRFLKLFLIFIQLIGHVKVIQVIEEEGGGGYGGGDGKIPFYILLHLLFIRSELKRKNCR